jgi:hypothetical protein
MKTSKTKDERFIAIVDDDGDGSNKRKRKINKLKEKIHLDFRFYEEEKS